jgi:hypothetical protein
MMGWVCRLQLLLFLASAVILGSESRVTATIFYCLRFETSLFVASYDSQGYGGGIRPRLHTGLTAARLSSSLYKLGADPTVNTASNNPIVVMGGSLTMDWISFPRERDCWRSLRNGFLFIRLLHSNGCTRCTFRGLCPATGLYSTI